MQKKVVSKGWTFHARSWENDSDLWQTIAVAVETERERDLLLKLCTELLPEVGNLSPEKAYPIVQRFLKANPEFTEDDVHIWSSRILGSSEYVFRVLAELTVTYSPEDVHVDVVHSFRR